MLWVLTIPPETVRAVQIIIEIFGRKIRESFTSLDRACVSPPPRATARSARELTKSDSPGCGAGRESIGVSSGVSGVLFQSSAAYAEESRPLRYYLGLEQLSGLFSSAYLRLQLHLGLSVYSCSNEYSCLELYGVAIS